MKANKLFAILLACGICASMVACGDNSTQITLSDEQIMVDGTAVSNNAEDAVYVANDLLSDAEDADAHTVVHITKPGTYTLSGTLSLGQIAVDLGEEAKTDKNAVVTLVLKNADITCTAAPAVIFYNAYECGSADEDSASKTVNTKAAGANVKIADKSVNTLNGSYIDDVCEGALYSTVSMNIDGGRKGNGQLFVNAEFEGVSSELHLTINGGELYINSGNDGINTNCDNVSVTTINGGFVDVVVNGASGEGDGIDSNGWIVINGGTVNAEACGISADSGLDSDKGIFLNGGNIKANGHMLDQISEGTQNYAVFSFVESQMGGNIYEVKNKKEETIISAPTSNDFTILLVSSKKLKEATYSFWCEDVQFFVAEGLAGGFMGDPSMAAPEDMMKELPGKRPEGAPQKPADMPEGNFEKPEGAPERPEGMPEMPEGMDPGKMPGGPQMEVDTENADIVFEIKKGGNLFHVFF